MTQDLIRPVRDRPTLVTYASLSTWAWFVYGFGASLALLRDDQGTSAWVGGLHGTALAAGGILGALATPRLNRRFGRGIVTRGAIIGVVLCILWFLWPGTPVGSTIAAIFVTCFFGNILVVCINSFIADHQGAASPAAFTESLSLAALMGLLAPLGVGLATASVLGWRAGLLVTVIAYAIIEVVRGRRLSVYGASEEPGSTRDRSPLPPLTWWSLVAGTCYIGAEFCLSLWGVDLLRDRAGLSPAAAAAGLATILGGIFLGRALGIRLTERWDPELLLRGSLIAGLVAFTVAWISTAPAVILVALFLTGFGLSLTWPLSMARIMASAEGRNDRAASVTLAMNTAAIGAAPFALGAVSGVLGVHLAFLIVPVLLVASLVLVVVRPVRHGVHAH